MSASDNLLKAAKALSVAAESLRNCPRSDGRISISVKRAELIAAIMDDAAMIFDEMSLAVEKVLAP